MLLYLVLRVLALFISYARLVSEVLQLVFEDTPITDAAHQFHPTFGNCLPVVSRFAGL